MVVLLLVLMSRNMYVQCLAQLISVRGEGIVKGRGVIINGQFVPDRDWSGN